MDKREACEILRLYRPGVNNEAEHPGMAEALHLARQDAELGKWFAGHCAQYPAVRQALKKIPVPAALQEKILRAEDVRRGRIVELKRWFVPLAAAAAIMVLAMGAWMILRNNHGDNFADYRERVVKQSQRGYAMTMTSTNLDAIHTFLLAKDCPDYVLTKPLAKMTGEGCATLEWRGRKVSMVCLRADKDKELFLFVMDRTTLQNAPTTGSAEFSQVYRLGTASWTEGDKVYVLAGPGDGSELKQYLN